MEAARAATAADIPEIVRLARDLRAELREMRGGALWEVHEARAEPLDDAFRALVDRTDTLVAVGTIDDTVVGYGIVAVESLRDGTALGVISELFVDLGARAVGVGEVIASELVAFCQARQCMGIDAFALPGHRDTKNFFERSGFTARELTMHRNLSVRREAGVPLPPTPPAALEGAQRAPSHSERGPSGPAPQAPGAEDR